MYHHKCMSGQVWLNLRKCRALCSCFAWSSFVLVGHKLIPWCVCVLSMLVECQAAVCKKTLALAMPKDKASCNLNLLNLSFFKWCRTIQGLNCKLTYKGLWWLFKSRIAESISAYCKLRFPFANWTSYPAIPLNNAVTYLDTFKVFKVQDIFAKYRLVQGCWIGREKKKLWKKLAPHAHVCTWIHLSFMFETAASHWQYCSFSSNGTTDPSHTFLLSPFQGM